MKIATIILNRNLPEVTNRLCDKILTYNSEFTDLYVVEAGSRPDNLSSFCTWHVQDAVTMKEGMRAPRGFNYGLMKIWESGKFDDYDFFFLSTNDAEYNNEPFIKMLADEMTVHKHAGIMTPCSRAWGEKELLAFEPTKYFWYFHNIACLIRRDLIRDVMELENPSEMNFLFDGSNFRGYLFEMELVAKAYANDWAAAITTKVWVEENESHLKDKAKLIGTDEYEENLRKYVQEGKAWLRRKYGFNSPWTMQMYAQLFYNHFFKCYPELIKYKV